MIKINDIIQLVNDGLSNHYFKDIKFHKLTELVIREEETVPAIYTGNGQYQFIQEDTNGLLIYHRITGEVVSDEDLDSGFGRNSKTTETYPIKAVFYGQQSAFETSNEDINFNLAKEFKKLIPRTFNLADRVIVTPGGINYNKEEIKESESIVFNPESVIFTIDYSVKIMSLNSCTELNYN